MFHPERIKRLSKYFIRMFPEWKYFKNVFIQYLRCFQIVSSKLFSNGFIYNVWCFRMFLPECNMFWDCSTQNVLRIFLDLQHNERTENFQYLCAIWQFQTYLDLVWQFWGCFCLSIVIVTSIGPESRSLQKVFRMFLPERKILSDCFI